MTIKYVEQKVREALKKNSGNKSRARQQILAWAYEDDKLLHALARPHLAGVVAYHIDRVLSGRADEQTSIKPPPEKAAKPANAEEQFGIEILKAISSGGSPVFGFENNAPSRSKAAPTSKGHADALRAMAAKSKNKTGA